MAKNDFVNFDGFDRGLPEDIDVKVNSHISNNLKKLLQLSNISPTELSRRTGVKQPIIHRLLSGKNLNPKLTTIKPLADYFLVTVSELIGEKEIEDISSGFTSNQHKGWCKVPLLTNEQIFGEANKDSNDKHILVNQETSESAFAIYINDDSMNPVFSKNCLVIIEPEIDSNPLDYVLVNKSGNEIIVRLLVNIDGKNYITPLNRNAGDVNALLPEDRIIGVVIRTIYESKVLSNNGD